MRYIDGNEAAVGDVVAIDEKYRGRVVCCIDAGPGSAGFDEWSYLGSGIMVDTDFGGLVHYTEAQSENLTLVERALR